MTVEEMLSRMSSRELMEWMAYYEMEPFGEERGDFRAGIIASTVANVANWKRKGRVFSVQDFMPLVKRPKGKKEKVKDVRMRFGHLVKRSDRGSSRAER